MEPPHSSDLIYTINDKPNWLLSAVLGFQHFIIMFGGTLTVPFIISQICCAGENNEMKAKLVSTIIFVSGIITFLQATLGVR